MNGIMPKTSRGNADKPKNIGSPIVIKSVPSNNSGVRYSSIEQFLSSTCADEQLEILKNIIDEQKTYQDRKIIEFLAIVYYEAPAKHPVKRFLIRHISKCFGMQQPFTNLLSDHISSQIKTTQFENQYEHYADVVPKLVACFENFPAGSAAVKSLDIKLGKYLVDYISYSREHLRKCQLSPTKKNEIYNLEHLILRLLVLIIQKLHLDYNHNKGDWDKIFGSITSWIELLIFDEDVPMDTKSLSGILLLTMETLKTNDYAWMDLLFATGHDTCDRILNHKAGLLAVYSAIATSVPMDELQKPCANSHGDTPAILVLLNKLLSITEGGSEGALILASARALLHLSKSLPRAPSTLGPLLLTPLLAFVWPHLEYHVDSVRHLAQQILGNALTYCAWLEKRKDGPSSEAPLARLLECVRALGECRAYYWCVSHAAGALGAARVLCALCPARRLRGAAALPHLHAAAMSAISALVPHGTAEEAYSRWVEPTLAALRPDNAEALQPVLAAAVNAHPDIAELMCSRARGSALVRLSCGRAAPACRALLTRGVLRAAARHPLQQVRLLALSCVSQSPRSTAPLSEAELTFALCFLRYNINEPAPNFRQLMISLFKKLLKRLEDGYKALTKPPNSAADGEHYHRFVELLRELCYSSLLRGANFERRSVALQLLVCAERIQLAEKWIWKEEYVEKLLLHLDDSYESNKDYALQVLQYCPEELLEKEYSTSVELPAILQQASSLNPSDSVSAAYKLRLLLDRLPGRLLLGNEQYCQGYTGAMDQRPTFVVLQVLLERARGSLVACERDGVRGAMFGVLHCIARLLQRPDRSWADSTSWRELADSLVDTCVRVNVSVAHVVTHAAPEGLLPAGEPGTLENGSQVTSQMVLVCAWRSVKEASEVLGASAGLAAGAGQESRAGRHLVALLRRATHRGALDTAAAGLHALAARCWRDPPRAQLPRQWVRSLMSTVSAGTAALTRRGAGLPAALQALLATEVQVTGRGECFHECMETLLRLATDSGDSCDSGDLCDLGEPCDPGDSCYPDDPDPGHSEVVVLAPTERRTLAANILRTLFRNTTLETASQVHVAAGLRVAVCGFGATAWPERTAMSLLFSALFVRVFGVWRGDREPAGPRNRLAGRVFYLRYPPMYALMRSMLSEEMESQSEAAVYPVLLLLGRLYPSPLDGTVSSLKVSSLLPGVQRCASRGTLHTRQLAARAAVALVAPALYFQYMEQLLSSLRPPVHRNPAHGALLQLARALQAPPPALQAPPLTIQAPPAALQAPPLALALEGTLWLLSQPCFLLVREYVGVINLIVWRFPELTSDDFISQITTCLHSLLFLDPAPPITIGRTVCLADCLLLYLVLLHKQNKPEQIPTILLKSIQHSTYEVVISAFNYLLILHEKLDVENCHFLMHLNEMRDRKVLVLLRANSTYAEVLGRSFIKEKYLECRQKCLRLLTLEKGTLKYVIGENLDNDTVISKLLDCIENGHENVTHIYLETLLKFTSEKRADVSFDVKNMLSVMKVVLTRSSADNNDSTRLGVVSYLETDMGKMMADAEKLGDCDKFEYRATILATLVTLLEDDDDAIRQRAADVATALARTALPGNITDYFTNDNVTLENVTQENVTPENLTNEDVTLENVTSEDAMLDNDSLVASASGELLRDYLECVEDSAALFVVLALLDFNSEVCMTDEISEECRVFDQSERYNIFLEETVWTSACADKINKINQRDNVNFVLSIVQNEKYCKTFRSLCGDNLALFEKITRDGLAKLADTVNPKIELFIRKLRI